MWTHADTGSKMHHSQGLDFLNWPVIGLNITVIAWFHDFWSALPTPTAIYTVVTIIFMLFQMADKLGWLDRLKRRSKAEPKAD